MLCTDYTRYRRELSRYLGTYSVYYSVYDSVYDSATSVTKAGIGACSGQFQYTYGAYLLQIPT